MNFIHRTDYSDGQYAVTDMMVCKSNRGYYIGTMCQLVTPVDESNTCMIGITQPNSRDSDYYQTQQNADKALLEYMS